MGKWQEVELKRLHWSPTADDTKSGVFRGDIVEGVIVKEPWLKSGRDSEYLNLLVNVDDNTDVIVKLSGYLGELWAATPEAHKAVGNAIKFVHTLDDNKRSRFKMYVEGA